MFFFLLQNRLPGAWDKQSAFFAYYASVLHKDQYSQIRLRRFKYNYMPHQN